MAFESAEDMAPVMPDLRPVGPELDLPGLGQAFALRHDVVDRAELGRLPDEVEEKGFRGSQACSGLGMGCGPGPLRASGPCPAEGDA